MTKVFLFAISLVACGSSTTPPAPDSPKMGSGSGAGFGSDCTVVSDTSTECASGVCTDSFNMFPTPVCSQKCTVLMGSDATCPVGSMGQKCNEKGYCRP
jgi:hypothetical protein